jgi:hypothetical protein
LFCLDFADVLSKAFCAFFFLIKEENQSGSSNKEGDGYTMEFWGHSKAQVNHMPSQRHIWSWPLGAQACSMVGTKGTGSPI